MNHELLNKIQKRDKLYMEVYMNNPNSNINTLKSIELENITKE